MALKIDEDHARFRDIIRGKIKQNLKKYITKEEMLGKKGKDIVSIPIPHIEIPQFKFGEEAIGGVGQGEGKEGDPLSPSRSQEGQSKAGNQPGYHMLEVEVTLEELADILGEELCLPKIKEKGKAQIKSIKEYYTGIRRSGPESLRHFKRTFRAALKRQIASGTYDPKKPIIIPVREDKRYRSWKIETKLESNAVIIYMMDVSGSMGDEQKEIVRIESFWIDTWLKSQYKGLKSRYIIHDAVAREVDQYTFFHTRESGGTMISSAYKLCADIIDRDYPASEWNIYPFHFSDGDNWSVDDTLLCIEILKKRILPKVNLFCYGQVESPYGSGQFLRDIKSSLKDWDLLITSEIKNKEGIVESIKDFLGKGK
jgi:hypothetical protein